MPDLSDSFSVSTIRHYLRIGLFVLKWLVKLLSASVEPFLRHNFGRRYVYKPFGACLFFLCCAGLNPRPALMSVLFFFSLLVLVVCHCIYTLQRNRLSGAEPHSTSAGDSWKIWQSYGFQKAAIQRYLEPALCAVTGLLMLIPDLFLGGWLLAAAVALFVKEQQSRFKISRRILDSIDAKIEAQALNTSLKQHQPGPAQSAQKSHRVYFPSRRQPPRP